MADLPRVCFVSPWLYRYLDPDVEKPAGGAQRQISMIADELSQRGFPITCLVERSDSVTKEMIGDLRVIPGCPTGMPSIPAIPPSLIRFWNAMRKADADVYYVRGAPKLAIATAIGSKLLNRPFLFCVSNDSDVEITQLKRRYGTTVRRAYGWMLDNANVVVAQTEHQADCLSDEFGVSSDVIPNGYELPPDGSVPNAEEREYVLWIGSSDRDRKRPELFLDLALELPQERFIMISKPMPDDDGYHEQLRSKASELDNLEFIGGVSPEAVHDYYKNAQLLVNTSATEGFPNTFLEAWRFATPVVSASFDLDDHLSRGMGGRYAGSADSLLKEVSQLVQSVETRDTLGWSGRKMLEEKYSLAAACDQYDSLIRSLH